MRLLMLVLVPVALCASQSRFARLGEYQGKVEVQLSAADPWMPAERNLPLTESAWVRTGAGGRVEVEMDDGSAWRLGPDSLGEISDYTRLSTGQRITLLSLDHGTAYYTGQPSSKDVTMLVMPGAQLTVLVGSRVRQTAQPALVQAAVLEGLVRFSSPAAEMDVREGTTARVDSANGARISVEPQIIAGALDNWSEGRDKMEASPASSAYVNAASGLADLDAAGKWVAAGDLGMVWKPDVATGGWTPYRNGRWRYYESLGYTWVSDDSWGWLPYHNGRWARAGNIGWVWQPSPNPVFHPGDVYWLRGANFTGWGPLAPGEVWNEPNPGAVTPQGYLAGSTTFASFRPDLRVVDGTGYSAPTAEQMKTAVFIPALPSPAFLTSRLDALRPTLEVGATRVLPSVPGVAFGDGAAPPSDLMTNPPVDPGYAPPVSDVGIAPPPDGVYPAPVVLAPTFDAQIPINPSGSDRPTYSPRRPAGGTPASGGTKPTPPTNPSSTPPASTSSTSTPPSTSSSTSTGNKPTRPTGNPPASTPSTPASRPVSEPLQPKPVAPPKPPAPVTPPKSDDSKKAAAMSERDLYQLVLKDINPKKPDFTKALSDLDTWTRQYPASASTNDRLYYYIHVYGRTSRPELVLDTAAPLVQGGVRKNYGDPQQVLQILVAVSDGLAKLRAPNAQQVAVGQKAARELLDFLPEYFDPGRKPSNVADAAWVVARQQLEDVGRKALAQRPAVRIASGR